MNRARPYGFSTALPPAVCGASLAALDIVGQEPGRRAELRDRAGRLREELRGQGWNLGTSDSQIVPLVVGEVETAMRVAEQLRELGLLVPAIRPPSVPIGRALLRISLSWSHDDSMIQRLVEVLLRCGPIAAPLQ